MHRLVLILILSLVGNAALAVAWWRAGREAVESPEGVSSDHASTSTARRSSVDASNLTPSGAEAAVVSARVAEADWESIHRELQAAGYPRAVIARVLQTLAGEQLSERYASIAGGDEEAYWKPRLGGGAAVAERMKEVFRFQREAEERMVALLGPDYLVELDDQLAQAQMRYGPLPPEKLLRVQAVERDFQEKRAELHRGGSGEEINRQDLELQRAMRTELARMLTAQELLEFDLRSSSTAMNLRGDYGAARLTEAEYRQLFALVQPMGEQLNARLLSGPDPTAAEMRRQAQKTLEEQIKMAFGPERAADLLQARDGNARQENALVARLGLPLSAARDVVSIREDVEQRANQLLRNSELSPAQRQEQLAALANDAVQRITVTLGERGMSAYREYGGIWLQRLTTPPTN